ncbi:RNA-directed DNA polymerase [Anaerobaca lacustris]|uniref:RNA-directed DNA polymerase n=1 Tax=Anaerobaca lacustris TaxID=3044600 RepID=A0AAW6TUF8_9BACT|nr:RNA-directed DNA polymerase [Sedimentisphaerales bacterium M17dextr]
MTLQPESIDWAIDFVQAHSDGDLFPKILEVAAIADDKRKFVSQIAGTTLGEFAPGSCRRFIVPKDEMSYRQATQLDPQDSIILSALVYQYGLQIESQRLPATRVFSYRFGPTLPDGLYSGKPAWNDFWKAAAAHAQHSTHILYCDIADFYNQVYHHTVENQLIAAALPNQAIKWIVALLGSTTAGVSRGVPVGPHAIHLIAESTLIPIDNSLQGAGLKFIRYADDILVFCRSDRKAKSALATVASVLDKQQRLTLQRYKTKIYDPAEFRNLCGQMIEDRPINADEEALVDLIKKYSGGDPYKIISYAQVSQADWAAISPDSIRRVIEEYINTQAVDYVRLRWFYRRLAQIGHPGAIEVSLEYIERLGPCFANICFYLASVQSVPIREWKRIGSALLRLLRMPEVEANEYFRLLILSLFTRNSDLNHFTRLRNLFQQADPFIRREVILAAKINGALDWIRELKEDYPSMDPWQQRAMLFALSGLGKDEKSHFIRRQSVLRPFDKVLAKWAKSI